jgi:alpha-D-ribose 1-methylphosphonate 5-triphosphate synthase subunit PhnG
MTDVLTTTRQCWMGILARASRAELEVAMRGLPDLPPYEAVRPAETGTVMVEGRAGGTGRRFNLGEAVVTRCTVRMGAFLGFSYCLGRDRVKALLAAQLDALLQDPARRETLLASVIEPLNRAQSEARLIASRKAAATRAEFFTLVRGD